MSDIDVEVISEEEGTGVDAVVDVLKGDKGDKGDKGETGDDGYTPVKGTDYFTSEEINEIESEILETLTPNIPTKTSDITNNSGFITKEVNNLTNYELKTNTGSSITLSINSSTYVMTLQLKNSAGTVLSEGTIDLPLETMVVGASYDNTTKKIILTLKNGTTVDFSVADLVRGLVSETQLETVLSAYYEKNEIDNLLSNKVDKVAGKGLSEKDFTTTLKNKLDGIATGAQANVLEGLTLNGTDLEISGKKTEIKDPEVTNARQSTAKGKTFESVDARIEELEADVDNIETTRGHVYGIRRKITSNSNSAWERLFDSIGKVANATKNGGTVQNDFDNLAPWSDIKSCNYDLTTKKINAWFGDANFKFDGTNGDVFTHVPKTYWKIYQENDYDYVLLADYPRAGFKEVDGFFVGRYNGSVVSDVLHSYSGLVPTTSKNRGQFRTLANALGSNFSQLDWRYLVLQMLYLVEYATYNSQSALGNGIQNRKYLKTLVAENSTNRAIVGSSSGYYVGQIIRIGTSDGGTQIADARKITAIEAYDEGGVTGAALTFDGAAVNIAVDNFVCTMAQETGQCDDLGMKSGCINNDGYHSMIYRGVENLFANIWQFVDGINIKDRLAYICKDHSQYADNVFADAYKPLAYTNADANGYAKTLGLDVDEPFFRFPTEVGGSTSTYMADYYYQNTGNRVARVGGGFNFGAHDGLWFWSFSSDSSFADWGFGCRVLIDNQ